MRRNSAATSSSEVPYGLGRLTVELRSWAGERGEACRGRVSGSVHRHPGAGKIPVLLDDNPASSGLLGWRPQFRAWGRRAGGALPPVEGRFLSLHISRRRSGDGSSCRFETALFATGCAALRASPLHELRWRHSLRACRDPRSRGAVREGAACRGFCYLPGSVQIAPRRR